MLGGRRWSLAGSVAGACSTAAVSGPFVPPPMPTIAAPAIPPPMPTIAATTNATRHIMVPLGPGHRWNPMVCSILCRCFYHHRLFREITLRIGNCRVNDNDGIAARERVLLQEMERKIRSPYHPGAGVLRIRDCANGSCRQVVSRYVPTHLGPVVGTAFVQHGLPKLLVQPWLPKLYEVIVCP